MYCMQIRGGAAHHYFSNGSAARMPVASSAVLLCQLSDDP